MGTWIYAVFRSHPHPERPDARVDRVLTERLLVRHTPLRLISLSLWVVFALAYRGLAPWWMIAAPAALHVCAILSLLWLAHAWRRDPNARSNESWRRLYILYAGLTGLAYGGGGLCCSACPMPSHGCWWRRRWP